MIIFYSPKFEREYRKLSANVHTKAKKILEILLIDPFSPTLKTHKLHGHLKNYWSCSIDYSYRILFQFLPNDALMLRSIGTHDIYE